MHGRKDFFAKIIIALKEADECAYWLELCSQHPDLPNPNQLTLQIESITKILRTIAATTKRKINAF